ncbi:latent-transforming growth factor beta-binding protein [Pimephales promelas]|nr:latent-transforming growth factor beta-binding protein [Pimephales promelas]
MCCVSFDPSRKVKGHPAYPGRPTAALSQSAYAAHHPEFQQVSDTLDLCASVPRPNVCGSRCCHSWLVNPKTKQCTKPRCHPRCHNKAVCRRANVCQCRPGFHGHRCEHADVNPTPGTWSEAQQGPVEHSYGATTATVTTATPASTTPHPDISTSASSPDPRKTHSLRWQPHSLKEAESVLLKRALSSGTGGEKITSVILKYIESERRRLESSSSTGETKLSSTKTFHTQRGQYTLLYTAGQSKPPTNIPKRLFLTPVRAFKSRSSVNTPLDCRNLRASLCSPSDSTLTRNTSNTPSPDTYRQRLLPVAVGKTGLRNEGCRLTWKTHESLPNAGSLEIQDSTPAVKAESKFPR